MIKNLENWLIFIFISNLTFFKSSQISKPLYQHISFMLHSFHSYFKVSKITFVMFHLKIIQFQLYYFLFSFLIHSTYCLLVLLIIHLFII